MYSIKIAAKLVKIKQLYKKAEEQLSNFIVLSTYYLTFRILRNYPYHSSSTIRINSFSSSTLTSCSFTNVEMNPMYEPPKNLLTFSL